MICSSTELITDSCTRSSSNKLVLRLVLERVEKSLGVLGSGRGSRHTVATVNKSFGNQRANGMSDWLGGDREHLLNGAGFLSGIVVLGVCT